MREHRMNVNNRKSRCAGVEPSAERRRIIELLAHPSKEYRGHAAILDLASSLNRKPSPSINVRRCDQNIEAATFKRAAHLKDCLAWSSVSRRDCRDHLQYSQ
jgi:hypothetical protein